MIDLAITSGASLEAYNALGAEAKALVASLMGSVPLYSNKAVVEAKIEEYKNFSAGGSDSVGTGLYVSKGLTVLLASYESFSTPYVTPSESSVLWANVVKEGNFATLEGTGWKKNATGGFTIVKTMDDYEGTTFLTPKENYGISVDGSLLPDADFTVELVANPVGISRADGSRHGTPAHRRCRRGGRRLRPSHPAPDVRREFPMCGGPCGGRIPICRRCGRR